MNINEISSSKLSDIRSTSTSSQKVQNNDGNFDSYLSKTYSYEDIINMASETYNVPSNLIKSVIFMESCFDADSTSGCGAMGLMQLMPVAAKEVGVSNAYDPVQNIMGGTKLLSNYLKKYNGDVSMALAAYNGGPGNVKKYNGIPPFCKEYVNRVKKYMNDGVKVPEKYVTVNITGYNSDSTANTRQTKSATSAPIAGKTSSKASAKNNITVMSAPLAKPDDTTVSAKQAETTLSAPVAKPDDTTVSAKQAETTLSAPVAKPDDTNTELPTYISDEDSSLTSAYSVQMLEAFRNYSDYMRVLELISESKNN